MKTRLQIRLRPEPIKERGVGSAYQAVPRLRTAAQGVSELYHSPKTSNNLPVYPSESACRGRCNPCGSGQFYGAARKRTRTDWSVVRSLLFLRLLTVGLGGSWSR